MMESYNGVKPTNSLVSGSFDVLKMDIIEDPNTEINTLATLDFEESYFVSSIDFLTKLNENFINNKIKLYKALSESSGDNHMILESFSDYFVQTSTILSKALKFIEIKMDNFNDNMESFIKANELIKEYKSKLEEYKMDCRDFEDMYIFNLKENIPDFSIINRYCDSLFDDLFKASVTDLSADAVKQVIVNMELEKDYDRFRAELIGIEGEVYASEFAGALYKLFHGPREEITIKNPEYQEIVDRFFKYADVKAELKESYNTIKTSFDKIEKKVSDICKNNNNLTVSAFTKLMPGDLQIKKIDGSDINAEGIMMSGDMMIQLDIYCKAKIDQLQKYTDFIIMAFTAKMDAYKDRFMQDRAVILSALDDIKYQLNKEESHND